MAGFSFGALYGRATALRRRYYAGSRAKRLLRPVVSVGNIAVGGRGKTPLVAHLAELLLARGERPAILSRGYARRDPRPGVTVVSDGSHVLADLARAGDEALMLARALPGVAVLVAKDRHWAGALAERRLGATVHLLDDGFQHVKLARDVDLVVVAPADAEARPLPRGRLREPFEAVRRADAVLIADAEAEAVEAMAERWGLERAFGVLRRSDPPRLIEPWGLAVPEPRDKSVFAVAGIAGPGRFFFDLERGGWRVAGRVAVPDHHAFSRADAARLVARARALGAEMILTTEKDATRLLPLRPLGMPVAFVPLRVTVEPAARFAEWLGGRLARAREARA